MKKIFFILFVFQLSASSVFAQDSSFGGDTSTDYSGGSTSDDDRSAPDSVIESSGSGRVSVQDAADDNGASQMLGNDNTADDTTTHRTSPSEMTAGAGNFFETVSHPTSRASSGSLYGFTAPLLTGKPWTGFLDLNGDGESGGLADALLYNLFASSWSDESTVTRRAPDKKAQDAENRIKNSLFNQQIPLTAALDSGATQAELSAVILLFNAYNKGESSLHDRQVAFESLLDLAIKLPSATAHDGPLVVRLWNAYRESYIGLFRQLSFARLANTVGIDGYKKIDANNYQLSLSRFAAVLVMHEQAERTGTIISERANDALRAAFYGVSLNIRKLKISQAQRQKLINSFMSEMSQSKSAVVLKMARLIANENQLESLRKGIYDISAMNGDSQILKHKGFKALVHLSAAATALAAWVSYGHHAINWLTLNIGQQWMMSRGLGAVIVLGTLFMSRSLYNKWIEARTKAEARRTETEGFGFKAAISPQTRTNINSAAPDTPALQQAAHGQVMMCIELFR